MYVSIKTNDASCCCPPFIRPLPSKATHFINPDFNHISGVMVSMLASSAIDHGSSPDRVKPKAIKLIFVASPLSTQH